MTRTKAWTGRTRKAGRGGTRSESVPRCESPIPSHLSESSFPGPTTRVRVRAHSLPPSIASHLYLSIYPSLPPSLSISIHPNIHPSIYLYIPISIPTTFPLFIHLSLYLRACGCSDAANKRMHAHIHMCACARTHARARAHTRTTHTQYTHTHTHTHTHTGRRPGRPLPPSRPPRDPPPGVAPGPRGLFPPPVARAGGAILDLFLRVKKSGLSSGPRSLSHPSHPSESHV